jgi:quercetin dioxygenase-like cupin family protein
MRLGTTSYSRGNDLLLMKDTSVTKVTSAFSPHGPEGQRYLASGVHLAMRLWENEEPDKQKPIAQRPYETVGYVISGRAELEVEGQTLILNAGDSWTVPRNASHTYKILEKFTAVEATSPPAHAQERDRE